MAEDDGIVWQRLDLIRIESRTDGKHKLHSRTSPDRLGNSTEHGFEAVLQCSHRGVNERLTGQAIPRKIRLDPAAAVVKWTGVAELWGPVKPLQVKLLWRLRQPPCTA